MTPSRSPAREGDVLPSGAEFAGTPPAGYLARRLRVGPITMRFERLDADVAAAIDELAGRQATGSDATPAPLEASVEVARSARSGFLAVPAKGEDRRFRLETWEDGGGLVMVTHHAALLCDGAAERGILVVARADAAALARSVHAAVRVTAAWRLLATGAGLLLHASAVVAEAGAVLFVGPTGAGKTTAATLSAPRPMLSDDVAVLTRPSAPGPWLAHPSPLWADAACRGTAGGACPVVLACRLAQAAEPSLASLSGAVAAGTLAAHAPFVATPRLRRDLVAAAADLAAATPVVRLAFARDGRFWTLLDRPSSAGASRGAALGAGAKRPARR